MVAIAVHDFKAHYPEFACVEDMLIDTVLLEAAIEVGPSWIATYQAIATMALAGHLLVAGGALSAGGQTVGPTAGGSIVELAAGDHSIKFAPTPISKNAAGDIAGYSTTPYGRRFLELRARSFPGVGIA